MRNGVHSIDQFLTVSRRDVSSMSAQIEAFAERVRAIRAGLEPDELPAAPAGDGGPHAIDVRGAIRVRDDALALAVEELRAQKETLVEAHARLELEHAKYVDLFLQAPDAYVTTDARGVVVDANEAAGRLFQQPVQVLCGKLLVSFVVRGDTREFRERLNALLAGPGGASFELRMRPRGGSTFVAALSVRPVRTPRGRTAALRWTLRAASPGVARGARDVQELLRVAVDELRAPLTTVLGWSRLLRDGALHEPERAPAVDAIVESAQAQKALLDDLGELVALAGGAAPAEEVDVTSLVDRAVERARAAAPGHDVRLVAHPVDARAAAGPGHLAWALDRLLAQAVYTAPDGGTVQVRIADDDDGVTVQARVHGAVALGGSRLAIAVATAAIEQHGGKLWLAELADDGVLFEVRLPRASSRPVESSTWRTAP